MFSYLGRRRGALVALAGLLTAAAVVGAGVARSEPRAKEAFILHQRELRDDALSQAVPPAFAKPTEVPRQQEGGHWSPFPHVPAGAGVIVEGDVGTFSGVYVVNHWYEENDGLRAIVYAGSARADPSHGVLIVVVETLDHKSVPEASDFYLTPIETGSLRVIGADSELLTLAGSNGTTLLFDVSSRLFLDPDTLLPLPTVTPVATPTPSPVIAPDPIAVFAVDTDVTGIPANTATTFGTIEKCRHANVGDVFDVDVVIGGIPPATGSGGGLLGFQFTLAFNGNVRVVGHNANMLLGANAGSSLFTSIEDTPVVDGNFSVAVLDVGDGQYESGVGVLIRITLEAMENGISDLGISDLEIVDSVNNSYPVPQLTDASRSQIKVGPFACP